MQIDPNLVGMEIPGRQYEVSWRETMNYAAGVGDDSPRYLDDTMQGGIVAPPLFAVTLTWPMIEGFINYLGDRISPQVVGVMVHATEHLIFHRLIRPADLLKVRGRVIGVLPTSRGSYLLLRLDAADTKGNEVFTEYNGLICRGVSCMGAGRVEEDLPKLPQWKDSSPFIWEVRILIPRHAAHVYDGCTNMVFPIHTSVEFARSVGLPDIVLQGRATLSLASREILNREAEGSPERLREISCRFTAIVIPGTELRVQLMGRKSSESSTFLGFRVLDNTGQAVIGGGFARLSRGNQSPTVE